MDGRRFKQLVVWQESVLLARALCKFTAPCPREERFGLTA